MKAHFRIKSPDRKWNCRCIFPKWLNVHIERVFILFLLFRVFPVWALILGSISHFLMVINSSMNILFYCVFNKQFREEATKILLAECGKFSKKDSSQFNKRSAPKSQAPKNAKKTVVLKIEKDSNQVSWTKVVLVQIQATVYSWHILFGRFLFSR